MVRRVLLFVAVNFLVIITISVILNVLGIRPYLTEQGINYEALLGFCLVWGMGGAFISLGLSRIMAKMAMGVQVIDPDKAGPGERQLLQVVESLARSANIPMPQVGVYESPEVNAFATGPTKSRSLVAVSTGLLGRMDHDEVTGVLSHEIAHIANGDMVTMTLLQGVVNAFAMFLARVLAFAAAQALRGRDEDSRGMSYGIYFLFQMLFEVVFMFAGLIVIAWFSRYREYRADAGGARLGGRERMISALEALQRNIERVDPRAQPAVQTLKISGRGAFLQLFSTHPPLADRINRLRAAA